MTPIHLAIIVSAAGLALYGLFVFVCWAKWPSLPNYPTSEDHCWLPTVTVVVVARNEASGIGELLAGLGRQQYPKANFELLLMDDNSDDQTVAIAKSLAAEYGIRFKSLPVTVPNGFSGSHKKLAIAQAAKFSQAEILVLTDADCSVGPGWLSSHIACYQTYPPARLVFGAFVFKGATGFWKSLLNLEALNLTAVAATTSLMGKPTMCSGANMSYRRHLVHDLSPFDTNLLLASGDDEFMLHAVHRKYPRGVVYNSSPASLVATSAPVSFTEFYNQRRRWAGKWKFYNNRWPRLLAVVVFAGNLGSILGWVTVLFTGNLPVLALLIFKCVGEFLLSYRVSKHFGLVKYLRHFLAMEIIYPFYAVFFGIASNFGRYQWKGRTYP